jgi:hypothetical protein
MSGIRKLGLLARPTRRGRVRLVGRLLRYKFADRPLVITEFAGQERDSFSSSMSTLWMQSRNQLLRVYTYSNAKNSLVFAPDCGVRYKRTACCSFSTRPTTIL